MQRSGIRNNKISSAHSRRPGPEIEDGIAEDRRDTNGKGPKPYNSKKYVSFRGVRNSARFLIWRVKKICSNRRNCKMGIIAILTIITFIGALMTLTWLMSTVWHSLSSFTHTWTKTWTISSSAPLQKFVQKPIPKIFTTAHQRSIDIVRPKSLDLPILLNKFNGNDAFAPTPEFDVNSPNPDYGGLKISFLDEQGGQVKERRIQPDPEAMEGHVWKKADYGNDVQDEYYAFDDEFVRNEQFRDRKLECRFNEFHRSSYPNCNTFHEHEIIKGKNKFLGEGAYRETFLQHEPFDAELVVKIQSFYNNPFEYDRYEFVRNDAIIMERLTGSPRIADIYGHCATSIYSEFLPNEVLGKVIPGDGDGINPKLHDEEDVDPKNKFTTSEKLDLALQMAESIADLHGYSGGVIVHDDVQLAQFLYRQDGSLILNDFNRGEIMLYDEKQRQYCMYKNGKGGGDYRAPEEYRDDNLNEKIDVWSFGNNIYALITGLWVFYDVDTIKDKIKAMKDGQMSYFDPRYKGRNYIEDRMIDLMYRCWQYKVADRADIFEAVTTLRETLNESKKLGIYEGRF